jgi:hypothetical protein
MYNVAIDRMFDLKYSYQFSSHIKYYDDVFLGKIPREEDWEKFFYFNSENVESSNECNIKYRKTETEEFWNIFVNDRAVKFSSKSKKLTIKERKFLRSTKGMSFLVDCSRNSIASLAGLKRELKRLNIC